MADSFTGAEGSVDKQKQSALDALAQFGRRGLEAAVLSQQESKRIGDTTTSANTAFASERGVDNRGKAELSALTSPGLDAYAKDRAQAVAFVGQENAAQQKVSGNYFDQTRQAIPMERTAAQAIRDQYAAAHAERQAAAAAEQRRHQEILQQVALEAQLERERMAREAELHRLELLGIDPLTGAPVAPAPAADARVPWWSVAKPIAPVEPRTPWWRRR